MPLAAPPLLLRVDRTWDGQAADPGEVATLALHDDGDALGVEVDAPFHGDPPPPAPPGPTWALWEHEVVELFVVGPGQRYLEVELGPHGHHLVLQLHGVRNVVARELPLDLRVTCAAGRWQARARLPRALLPPGPHLANAYAIHGRGAGRRYLAWTPVPGPAPDFHRLPLFPAVTLPPRRG
ncbi:hypothetical protein L6R53_16055 [Myxococcota bacterium]|nr:hypothetical protein [Myxococcota bacterium]